MSDSKTAHQARDAIRVRLDQSAEVHKSLAPELSDSIYQAALLVAKALDTGNKLLLCGNGGSAADCQHVAAELTCRLSADRNRRALAAIALTTDTSFLTAFGNDYGFDGIFARQVEALGKKGDVLIAISTSGNSKNVILAAKEAQTMGLNVIALTGSGGTLHDHADLSLKVPASRTALIQEAHLTLEHVLCEEIENILFGPLASGPGHGT